MSTQKDEPISAEAAYNGNGSNEELWPILASHGAVTDPSDMRDSYLATVLINWRNAACKDVADRYQEAKSRAEESEAELVALRTQMARINSYLTATIEAKGSSRYAGQGRLITLLTADDVREMISEWRKAGNGDA